MKISLLVVGKSGDDGGALLGHLKHLGKKYGQDSNVEVTKTVGRGRNARTVTLRRLQMKPLEKLTPEQRALVEGIETDGVRPAMPSKLGALAQLAKLDGLDQPVKFSGELAGAGTVIFEHRWIRPKSDKPEE